MCNCLITEDSCRPDFRILEQKAVFVFSVTRLSVSYSKRSTKHANLQSIFTITLPIDKTAIQFTITLKKKMTTDQPNHNIVVVVELYPVLPSDY